MKFKRIIPLFFIAVLLSSFSISVGRALAYDEVFYSGNNVLFYNPDAQTCRVSANAVAADGSDNKANAYNYYLQKGLTGLQAAAIVGNFQQESNVNPKALNGIGAYGIAQWLGGREQNLKKEPYYVSGDTDASKELTVQLDFSWKELQGGENGAFIALTTATTTSAGELAVIFGEAYERYGSTEEGKRAQYAEEIYQLYSGSTTVTTSSSSASSCSSTKGAGQFVYYSQKDAEWALHPYGPLGNIRDIGCGPSSLAMIVATFKDKTVTPVEVADAGAANGSAEGGLTLHGPLLEAAKEKWGIDYQDITGQPFDQVVTAVKAGNLVYMGGSGAAPFTAGGHVVVIRGITDDGKVLVADPYRSGADVYTQAEVQAGRGSTFIINK